MFKATLFAVVCAAVSATYAMNLDYSFAWLTSQWFGAASSLLASGPPISHITRDQWESLNDTIQGRLLRIGPVSAPCFTKFDFDFADSLHSATCEQVQAEYTSDEFRAPQAGATQNTQWETCQTTNEQCLLSFKNPNDTSAFEGKTCHRGSISPYYIDVRSPRDAAIGFKFAKDNRLPIAIRNSGHDWKGRSTQKNSLGLYVHNIQHLVQDPNFVPEGCPATKDYRGITIGAGVSWGIVYRYAEAHNITIIGGASQTVTHTGWVSGAGHGALTNTFGLGVSRVLQFKIVTARGDYLVANACQNTDLFWALKGGGGGTYGLIIEATTQYEPQLKLQVADVIFDGTNYAQVEEFLRISIKNSVQWARDGWGGYQLINRFGGSLLAMTTPKLNAQQAAESMKEIVDWGKSVGASVSDVREVPSFFTFFETTFLGQAGSEVAGAPVALSSRLVPDTNFAPHRQEELLQAVLKGLNISTSLGPSVFGPTLQILPTTPYNKPPTSDETPVTQAWTGAIWHLVYGGGWDFDSTVTSRKNIYDLVSKAVDPLRSITPVGAYINEADVHEPKSPQSFWGLKHYAKLVLLKRKYDPNHLLDCWQCVDWKGEKDPLYACYQ